MPPHPDDPESFRETMRLLPSPVSVVTAMDELGTPRGLTCSAVCSLSMAPPSMLICVNRRNRSLEAIRHSGGFMVNLLRAGRTEMSDVFASSLPTKFANTVWQPSPASGLPLLVHDALAFVDCGLQAEIEAGSHVILIGLVRGSGAGLPDGGPLVYWRRSYGAVQVPNSSEGDDMSECEVSDLLLAFIRKAFLGDDSKSELDETTPLLEWGILNSMNTAILLNFIRDEFDSPVPPARIDARNFRDVHNITAMVLELMAASDG
jgi:flavin reductase (DIM6/NTAB) family NADH-FMN oxidoreductase RutF/acyl carrier protein